LTFAILKELKEVDESCRDSRGKPIQGQKKVARQSLGHTDALRVAFDANARSAEKLVDQFRKKFAKIGSPTSEENQVKRDVDRLSADLTKYKDYVKKFFDRAMRDFGSPIRPKEGVFARTVPPVPKALGLRIRGSSAALPVVLPINGPIQIQRLTFPPPM